MSTITRKTLQKLGMIVDIVKTGDDIYDKILFRQAFTYDVIITNKTYKQGDSGPMTLRHLKSIYGFKIPVILLTVEKLTQEETDYLIEEVGFYAIIQKPLDEIKITSILDKIFNEDNENIKFNTKKDKV